VKSACRTAAGCPEVAVRKGTVQGTGTDPCDPWSSRYCGTSYFRGVRIKNKSYIRPQESVNLKSPIQALHVIISATKLRTSTRCHRPAPIRRSDAVHLARIHLAPSVEVAAVAGTVGLVAPLGSCCFKLAVAGNSVPRSACAKWRRVSWNTLCVLNL
jgi:hypothetical protein